MSCKCQIPKKMKNSAGGVDFYVCAKSLGGCGEEIGSAKTIYAGKATITIGGKVIGEITNVTYNINPHIEPVAIVTCPECEGGCFTMVCYGGMPVEKNCEYCGGAGEVEDI